MSSSWSRQSNVVERSVNKAPDIGPLSTARVLFLTKPKDVVYYSLSESHIVVLKKIYIYIHFCKHASFNTFKNIGRILAVLYFYCKSVLPFLCKGVTFSIFKQDGDENDLKELLMFTQKSECWEALFLSNLSMPCLSSVSLRIKMCLFHNCSVLQVCLGGLCI